MKYNSKLLVALTFMLMTTLSAFAQSSVEKAQAHYFAAVEAFDRGDYQTVLEDVQKAESISGETGEVLLKLETKALYELGRFQDAKSTLNEFYESGPSADSKREMASILLDIDKKIEEERLRQEKQRKDKAEQLRRDKLQAEEARIKANRQRSIQATIEQEGKASFQRLLGCDSGEKCLEISKELVSYHSAITSENLDIRKVGKYYRSEKDLKSKVRWRLVKRSCEVYNYDDGCLAFVGEWVYPNAVELVSNLCDKNHAEACFSIGYGLAGIHLDGIRNLYSDKFNGRSIVPNAAVLFGEKGKSLRFRDKFGSLSVSNEDRKLLMKEGIPYILKSCDLGFMDACFFIAIQGKSNKFVSKKLRKRSLQKICELYPRATKDFTGNFGNASKLCI